jgi:excisionase family DNA binding protein
VGAHSTARIDMPTDPVRAEEDESQEVVDLAKYLAQSRRSAFLVSDEGDRKRIPPSVHELLVRIVHELARGNAVSIVPVHHMLTTQEAANLLNVSRPHLVKLLEAAELPFELVGSHRRIRIDDLLAYRERRSRRRREILTELAEENTKLGI